MDKATCDALRKIVLNGTGGKIKLDAVPQVRKALSYQMLRGTMRDYIIHQVKKPIMKALITLANRYPEPTRDNCVNPNSHILLDIQHLFFEYEDNQGRVELFKAVFRILIAQYEHDPYYRGRMNWFIEELVKATMNGKWTPRGNGRPIQHWNEPEPYGMYAGRRFKKFIKVTD